MIQFKFKSDILQVKGQIIEDTKLSIPGIGVLDLSSKRKVSKKKDSPVKLGEPAEGEILGTYKMSIKDKQRYFITVDSYIYDLGEHDDNITSVIFMSIGSDDPRHGITHYVRDLANPKISLNMQIVGEYIIFEDVSAVSA